MFSFGLRRVGYKLGEVPNIVIGHQCGGDVVERGSTMLGYEEVGVQQYFGWGWWGVRAAHSLFTRRDHRSQSAREGNKRFGDGIGRGSWCSSLAVWLDAMSRLWKVLERAYPTVCLPCTLTLTSSSGVAASGICWNTEGSWDENESEPAGCCSMKTLQHSAKVCRPRLYENWRCLYHYFCFLLFSTHPLGVKHKFFIVFLS